MKKKLIKLNENSCNNLTIERGRNSNYSINYRVYQELKKLNPEKFLIPNSSKEFVKSEDYYKSNIFTTDGFNFKEDPPLAIGITNIKYQAKYGTLIPFLSYLFWWNYTNKIKFKKFAKSIGTDVYVETLFKHIEVTHLKYFIIQGTIYSEITLNEYQRLSNLFSIKFKDYKDVLHSKQVNEDIDKLNERLKKLNPDIFPDNLFERKEI